MSITPPISLSSVLFLLSMSLRRQCRHVESDCIYAVAKTIREGKPDIQIPQEWDEDLERDVEDALEDAGWEVEVQTDQTSYVWVISDPANSEESECSFEFGPQQVVIVSRHPAQVEYLRSLGYEGIAIAHATAKDVAGMTVIGNLPMNLACLCKKVGCADMTLPPELRGCELTLEQVQQYSTGVRWYRVTRDVLDQD
jgi:hypothetical protein